MNRQCRPDVEGSPQGDSSPSRLLFASQLLWIGSFRLPADHDSWRSENCIGPGHHFVFPRVPVGICQAGDDGFVASPSEVVFYNPRQPFTRQLLSDAGDRCEWFVLREDVLADALRAFDPMVAERRERLFRFSHGPSSARAYLAQRLIFEHILRDGDRDALLIEEAFLRLAPELIADAYALHGRVAARRQVVAQARREMVDEARRLIAARYAEPLSLAELSARVGTSPFHLCRVFSSIAGVSMHRFQTRLRLRVALERILEGARDLTDVALDLGFSSHSHFSNSFRREFHASPSSLRDVDLAARLYELVRSN